MLLLPQNGCHFAGDIFKCIFFNEKGWISISPRHIPKGPIGNKAALVQMMAWRQTGDEPLSEPTRTVGYRADRECRMDGQTDRRTSLSMNKPTTWCKSGWVSLVSSSCLCKTQPERALAQVCHTRRDAFSPDKYQLHLLLHRNSHHSEATYPKWLNHWWT